MGLRLVGRDTTRIDLSEGSWIEVKKKLSKRDFIDLMEALPDSTQKAAMESESGKTTLKLTEALGFQQALFGILVTAWSVSDRPSVDEYLELENEGSAELDGALMAHFKSLMPTKDESSKRSTSQGSRRKG